LPVKETGWRRCGPDAARNTYESKVGTGSARPGEKLAKVKDLAQDDYDTKTGHGAKAADQKSWKEKFTVD
jgi:hypothetical protein